MRLLDFFDGFTSGTEPLNGIVSADSLKTFTSDAAYVTAKGSVATDGDCYYNTVSDQIKVYSNGAWISIDNPPIDLASSEVTGTLPLNKGGTNATTKSAAFDSLSPMTTSGDVIYGGASGTGTRLAKGTDGQVLTLASGLPAWTTLTASSLSVTTKTANYTITSSDAVILADASAGGFTLTLPASSGISGKVFYIKKIDSTSNVVTLARSSSDTIDLETFQEMSVPLMAVTVLADGSSKYYIL